MSILLLSIRSLLNEISVLERRVHELRYGTGPGAAGAAGEEATALNALRGGGTAAGGGGGGTSEGHRVRMKRDRELHRLGLRGVADMSREVLSTVIQVRFRHMI